MDDDRFGDHTGHEHDSDLDPILYLHDNTVPLEGSEAGTCTETV